MKSKNFKFVITFSNEEEGINYCLKKDIDRGQIRRYKLDEVIPFSSRLKGGNGAILSNMYACNLFWNGMHFNSLEQLYYYFRFDGEPDVQAQIMACKNAFDVKRLGKKFGGGKQSNKVFEWCLKLKYLQCEEFRKILEESGDKPLVEYAEWGDVKNGCCKFDNVGEDWLIGQNTCGRLMMKVREEMKNRSL